MTFMIRADLCFATPRKLPKAASVKGRVVVVDVAFASDAGGGGFNAITRPFLDGLGARLAAWVDHHDHEMHYAYMQDPRFVLSTKAEHGACPEMVTPELCARIGSIDSIVCHTDFDGLCSAAKWLREGIEPYPGADADARAIDTRLGTPSAVARRIDRAVRARSKDAGLLGLIVRHLASGLEDRALWHDIDAAGAELEVIERETLELSRRYRTVAVTRPAFASCQSIAWIDVTEPRVRYDKTMLLLLGQERASVAFVLDRDTLSIAAPFNSGLNFVQLLGLSGGMPTVVSTRRDRLADVLDALGVSRTEHLAMGL